MHVRSIVEFLPVWRALSLGLIVLLGCMKPVWAEDDWYQVEVLVFEQAGGPGSDNHQLGLRPGYPDNWRQLSDPGAPPNPWLNNKDDADEPAATDATTSAALKEQPYTLLPASERRLNGEARSLERSSSYRVLSHRAWRQPLGSRASSVWILLRDGQQYGEHHELEGALRIYLQQRALLAQTRLWHTRFQPIQRITRDPEAEPETESIVLPAWPAPYGGETPLFERLARESAQRQQQTLDWSHPDSRENLNGQDPAPALYSGEHIAGLEQTRRLELGTTLYMDHPELGVLVHITRYQRGATGDGAPGEAEDTDDRL